MKKTIFCKILSLFTALLLIAAMALFAVGCGDTKDPVSSEPTSSEVTEVSFTFKVTNGTEVHTYPITTDKKTVGDALLELGFIEGEESQYGLFVKKVDGIVADYDVDGTYWAFYVDGAYATSGVDTTEIKNGATYEFKKEK